VILVGELSPTIHENFRTVASRYLAHDLLIASMNLAMSRPDLLLGRFWSCAVQNSKDPSHVHAENSAELLVAQSVQTSDADRAFNGRPTHGYYLRAAARRAAGGPRNGVTDGSPERNALRLCPLKARFTLMNDAAHQSANTPQS
jgi:hypothetical protein